MAADNELRIMQKERLFDLLIIKAANETKNPKLDKAIKRRTAKMWLGLRKPLIQCNFGEVYFGSES